MVNWKNKLLAYLHDPPSKALDIASHIESAETLLRQAGFSEDEVKQFAKEADWAASAADRLPFPSSLPSGLRCHFDGVRNRFHHPLGYGDGAGDATLAFEGEFVTSDAAKETDQSVQPILNDFGSMQDSSDPRGERWRARFFAHWRLYPKHAAEHDYRFAFLPADTRIPDHTIWTHMQVVSALAGCASADDPKAPPDAAFLKFQLGPVQEFIAAARSIRDLWSGSYLLSWLMAAGLKAFSAQAGPDAVIFPNLRGQPLFDLHWRNDLWSQVRIGGQSVWESLGWDNRSLLTPNLPNVFLAVVPREQADDLARLVETAIQKEWERIAGAVWRECEEIGLTSDEGGIASTDRKTRFDSQAARFLSLSWQTTAWPNSLEDALKLAEGFGLDMPIQTAKSRVDAIVKMATKQMDKDHRDRRYYTDESKQTLNNVGLGWSVILAFNSWSLDAVRQTRSFAAANAGGWQVGAFNNKDSLTGRDEAVAGGREWCGRSSAAGKPWSDLFKNDDWVSASTLIKRVWHRAYLQKRWGLDTGSGAFPMPNTRGIAMRQPEVDCGDDDSAEDCPPSEKYFAVLALDGDEMGKWISGEKTPHIVSQLADYADGSNAQRQGAKVYFERPELKGFLASRRALSPSYHLQFSEALSNFVLLCARPIVQAFDGRLIYAGGDDVRALLPADTALACAVALRLAFQGREVKAPNDGVLFSSPAPGFLCAPGRKDHLGRSIPFLVPGPAADCSVGIAIAHFKSPLQDVVRAAQAAEKRAKKQLDRSAVAVTLFKRSGETIEWGCKWGGGGLELYHALSLALDEKQVSGKFPYRVVELLEPYLTQQTGLCWVEEASGFKAASNEIIQREFTTVCSRQRGPQWKEESRSQLLQFLAAYTKDEGSAEEKLRGIIGLCQTVAFANRTSGAEEAK